MSEEQPTFNDAQINNMDWMIQNLISVAEKGIEVSVTLTTTGGVISGRLISGKAYVDLVIKQFNKVHGDAGADTAGQLLAEWAQELAPVFSAYDEDGPYFIHLADVVVAAAGNLIQTAAPWRGNLAQVTGIILGKINVS